MLILGSVLGPKTSPKLVKTNWKTVNFRTLIFRVLKHFKCLLRAVLSLLCSSWEPPRLKKYSFPVVKSHFLQLLLFGTLRLLRSFLGPSWRIMASLAPKWLPKWTQNGAQQSEKNVQKWVYFLTSFLPFWGPILGSILGPKTQQTKYALGRKAWFTNVKIMFLRFFDKKRKLRWKG